MRRVALITFLAAAGMTCGASPASAAGGVYNVLKCHPWHIEADEIEQAGGHPSYSTVDDCNGTSPDPMIGIYDTGAAGNNAYSQYMYTARPNTHFEAACLDYKLRRDNHHRAEILALPGFQVLASGGDDAGGWVNQCFDLNGSQLIVRLSCSQAGGCPAGPNAHAYVRNIGLTVSDDVDPQITSLGGDLLAGGWVRGTRTLAADATDAGSGIYHLMASVNAREIAQSAGRCHADLGWNFSKLLMPCEGPGDPLGETIDTAGNPFVNGANTLAINATDYGGNTTAQTRTVFVDNAPPAAAFADSQEADDPEAIGASVTDLHSGVAAAQIFYRAVGATTWQPLDTHVFDGQARAHVESSGVPPGTYEFRLVTRDVAGNEAETTLRRDGTPMRLTFPLRSAVELRTGLGSGASTGQTVPYGTSSEVHGRLLDLHGAPIAGQPVVVVDRFDNGALYPRAERPVVTDADGRFTTPEPAGPTRSIEAIFAGSNRYLPDETEVGKFAVKGAATFKTSADQVDEGTTLVFAGKVRHHGARIPPGGKLVEVQYRLKTGRQRTLKEPFRTDPDGQYRLAYRFSKALTSDALFHFRLKVRGEGNWPFKGSTSKWRKVVVRAR